MNQIFQLLCVTFNFIFVLSIPDLNLKNDGIVFEETVGIGIGGYKWQECGIGYNFNTMINSWLYYIAVEDYKDFSLVMDYEEGMLSGLECAVKSNGVQSKGWNCIFEEIPNLHVIQSVEEWRKQLVSYNVSEHVIKQSVEEINNKGWGAPNSIFTRGDVISTNLKNKFGFDHRHALSIIYNHIWKHITPWMRSDIDSFYDNNDIFKESSYIGLHIRRGDKIYFKEANATNTEEYLIAALQYFDNPGKDLNEIKGIWVASDDTEIIHEVRNLSSTYFPNILPSDIVYYSDKGIDKTKEGKWTPWDTPVATRSNTQKYDSFLHLFLDIEMLSKSEVFVGTFSSNLGRFVVTARESFNKRRDSSISVDWKNWFPGRK